MKETLWYLSFFLAEQKFEIHTDFGHFWTDFPDISKIVPETVSFGPVFTSRNEKSVKKR
jgi:hypothetical protein